MMTFSTVTIASWHLGVHFAGTMQDNQDIVCCHRSSRRACACVFLTLTYLTLSVFLKMKGLGPEEMAQTRMYLSQKHK